MSIPRTIIADENIPFAKEMLSSWGNVRLATGRQITRETIADADALIVRSVTRVDESLLAETPVQFVGTATIGTDHIDREYLHRAGIVLANAKGSNARSVAEYIIAALLENAVKKRASLEGKTLGVIGCGNIGSTVRQLAPALGMRLLLNDPPLQQSGADETWTDFETVLGQSDYLTLHVPLNKTGKYKTAHLIGRKQLQIIQPSAVIINTSRGPVIDNTALLDALLNNTIAGAVLDVFEHEPNPNWELVYKAAIATPHIAGYSLDGKIAGTKMIADALAAFYGPASEEKMELESFETDLQMSGKTPETIEEHLLHFVRQSYDLRKDDGSLRHALAMSPELRHAHFDRLRKDYPARYEFSHYRIPDSIDDKPREKLHLLGFH